MTKLVATVVAGVLIAGIAAAGEHPSARQVQKKEAPEAKVTLQTTCPVMGGKVNKDLYVDQDGKRIYVCCKGCIAPVRKDFAKYVEKVEAAGEVIADAPVEKEDPKGGHEGHKH